MTYKLVIADDELTIRKGLAHLVPTFGLPVEIAGTAADGREALRLIERVRPELMLLDINMPHMGGLALLERVSAELPESRTIIISGYDQFEYARRALQLGVFDYLLKPVNKAVLKNALLSAVRSLEQRRLELDKLTPQSLLPEQGDLIDRALRIVHSRLNDPALSLSDLAASLNVSSAYLSRGIKQRTGENFSACVTRLRMEQAMELLRAPANAPVGDIAARLGYTSQHYFCRIFKEFTGLSPTEFRRQEKERARGEKDEKSEGEERAGAGSPESF